MQRPRARQAANRRSNAYDDADLEDNEARGDKARARNRAAQVRYRERQQAEHDQAQRSVQNAQQRLSDTQERHATLQRHRVDLSSRTANAAAALAAARAAAACADRSTEHAPAAAAATALLPTATQPLRSCHVTAGMLISHQRRPHSLFTTSVPRPPRISSFHAAASISVADICAAAGGAGSPLDFSQHTLPSLLEKALGQRAARHGCATRPSAVCWFVKMQYDVEPGLPLSASATLSSPECLASFVLQFMMVRLELALLTHAADSVRTQGRGAGDMHGGAGDQELPPRKAHQPCSPSGSGTGPASDGGGGAIGCGAGISTRVRCGVNRTEGATRAVRAIARGTLQRFCRLVPLGALVRLLQTYLASLRRRCSIVGATRGSVAAGGDAAGKDGGHSFEGLDGEGRRRQAQGVQAVRAIMVLMLETVGELADVWALRQLVAEDEVGVGEAPGRTSLLEAQAHRTLSAYALMHCLALRHAPRTIRMLCQHSIIRIARFYEIESIHVHLYRQLQLTAEDRLRLQAHWVTWVQLCKSLNAPFHRALSAWHRLVCKTDLPAHLVRHVNDIVAGAAVAPTTCVCERTLTLDDGAAHSGELLRQDEPTASGAFHACATTDTVCSADAAVAARVPREVRCVATCTVGPGWRFALRLLGASCEATIAAQEGLVALREVHDLHGRMRRETMELQMQPGLVLRPLQLARIYGTHVVHNTAPADFMQLCQLAAAQQRWLQAFKVPPVLRADLPHRDWADIAQPAPTSANVAG